MICRKLIFIIAVIIGITSCKPTDNYVLPTITTNPVVDISDSTVVCGGLIESSGDCLPIIARGICWSINPNPTISDYYNVVGRGLGFFESEMSDLIPLTKYYIRAYMKNNSGIIYGDELQFTTLDESIVVPGPDLNFNIISSVDKNANDSWVLIGRDSIPGEYFISELDQNIDSIGRVRFFDMRLTLRSSNNAFQSVDSIKLSFCTTGSVDEKVFAIGTPDSNSSQSISLSYCRLRNEQAISMLGMDKLVSIYVRISSNANFPNGEIMSFSAKSNLYIWWIIKKNAL